MAPVPSTKNERNYVLRIEARGFENPKIIRTLSVPPSTTFHKLHFAIQYAFGWERQHDYEFAVYNKPPIDLTDQPRVGRKPLPPKELLRIESPTSPSPLEAFIARNAPPTKPGPPTKPARTTPVSEIFGVAKYRNQYIEYMYDFGDSWDHAITLIGRAEEDLPPDAITCVSGEGGSVTDEWSPELWDELKRVFKLRNETDGKGLDDKEKEWIENWEERHGEVDEDTFNTCDPDEINEQLLNLHVKVEDGLDPYDRWDDSSDDFEW